MIQAFEFEDGGRTYSCQVEQRRAARPESWWWFAVSGDEQRYAPFLALADDTRESVRKRVIAFYSELLIRRARPPEPRPHWTNRNKGAAAQSPK